MVEEIQASACHMTAKEVNQHGYPARIENKCKPAAREQGTDEEDRSATEKVTGTGPNFERGKCIKERIVSHVFNGEAVHPLAKKCESLYRVRWYGYDAQDGVYNPIKYLARRKITRYYRRKKV